MSEPMPTLTAMEKTAKHKGRANSCVRCSRTGKSYIDVKSRVENHIYKYHLALDQCPFYCTLCLFRSSEKASLQQHVHTYNRHRQEAKKMGITDSTPYLQESPSPYIIGDSDYVQHSQQESLKLFLQKSKHFQSEPDLLASAINQTFGRELINEGPAIPAQTISEPSTATADPTAQLITSLIATLQKTITPASHTPTPTLTPASTPLMIQTNREDPPQPQPQTPIILNPTTPNSNITMTCNRPSGLNTPILHIEDQQPAPSSSFLSDLIDEDLTPQLLGTNTEQLSPALPATIDATSTTSTCTQSNNQLNKEIMDVLSQNTRAIRCFEKTVTSQNQIMKALNDAIRDLNQTIINSACEERRREEDRKRRAASPCKDQSNKRRKTDHHSGHKENRR